MLLLYCFIIDSAKFHHESPILRFHFKENKHQKNVFWDLYDFLHSACYECKNAFNLNGPFLNESMQFISNFDANMRTESSHRDVHK